jgi:hypothetical protein
MKLAITEGGRLDVALGQHRATNVILPNGVIIRDQIPMPPKSLAPALQAGLTPSDWYRFLNGFVFLWANRDRVERHLIAFRKRPQTLLVFDAARLIEERGDELLLSPINSGNAMRRAAPRSYELFVPYREWLKKGWPPINGHSRSMATVPAEIVIKDGLSLEPYLTEMRET